MHILKAVLDGVRVLLALVGMAALVTLYWLTFA